MSNPPAAKRAKLQTYVAGEIKPEAIPILAPINDELNNQSNNQTVDQSNDAVSEVLIQFRSVEGVDSGPPVSIPINVNPSQLTTLINQLLSNDQPTPYSFFFDTEEITETLQSLIADKRATTEQVLPIVYQPQALFRVRSVARCSATLPGHSEAILCVQYSASSKLLVTGSGDCTARIWDALTSTPLHILRGHRNHVLCAVFSPSERCVATASLDNELRIWSMSTGTMLGKPYKGHTKWITSIAWEPYISNPASTRICSGSKDGTIRIWDVATRKCLSILSGHTGGIQCVRWGGEGLIYSASQDRTIKVWSISAAGTGKLVRTLEGHAHWVNHLSLSTDAVLAKHAYDQRGKLASEVEEENVAAARAKYATIVAQSGGHEMLVSGSEDFTLMLWNAATSKQPIIRMTGHQQPINYVAFSPDARTIASASFDKSVKLWNGQTGKFVASLRGHVGAIYQVCWAADSRLVASSSKDSTIKVWDVKNKKMEIELPGHADEVFALDWSGNGEQVASGGKDRVVKVWRN